MRGRGAGRGASGLARALVVVVLVLPAVPALSAAGPERPDPHERLNALRRDAAGPKPPSPSVLSDRLTDIAAALLETGSVDEAIELFSEALGDDPDNGAALEKLIVAYLQHDDVEFADFYLEMATASVGRRNARAESYRVIGDLFEARNRTAEAVSAWDYFRRLGGRDAAVDVKLERARGEIAIRRPQRLRESEGLSLYTDASIPEAVVDRVEKHLREEIDRLDRFFEPAEPVGSHVVIVYEGRGYFSLVSIPTWVSGVFDGKIRVSVDAPARWSAELAGVLSHELAHSYLRSVSRGRAPAWIHEGLGEWFQGQRFPRSDLREWFARRDVLTLEEMDAVLARRTDREETRHVYLEALGLTEFLIDERGSGAIACLVRDLASGESVEDALRRETGWSSRDLIQRWKKAVGISRASDKVGPPPR